MEEPKLEPSEELAYLIGVAQTDGSLIKIKRYDRRGFGLRLSFIVSSKSLPMIEKVKEIASKILDRHARIYKDKKREKWHYFIQIKQLLSTFQYLDIRFDDPPEPSKWILEKPEFFGSYSAGVIDGDGDVRISRRKYPQCAIRITSGSSQEMLGKAIKEILKCGCSITFRKRIFHLLGYTFCGSGYTLEFYVSSKTIEFIQKYVLPWIQISHKRQVIEKFMEIRGRSRSGS